MLYGSYVKLMPMGNGPPKDCTTLIIALQLSGKE